MAIERKAIYLIIGFVFRETHERTTMDIEAVLKHDGNRRKGYLS